MKTRIFLEFGCNHQGCIEVAKEMIREAARLGVVGVKLQKRDLNSIPADQKKAKRDPAVSFGDTYGEHRAALEFTMDQILDLKSMAEEFGLEFACSAFDVVSLIDLLKSGVKWVKFPSQLLLNQEMSDTFKKYRSFDQKLMVSGGMHTDIEHDLIKNIPDVFYHCVSIYPTPLNKCNIQYLINRKNNYYHLGYSSHDIDALAVPFAVMAGAEYIERHFTLNKKWKGSDHATVSSTPDEIKKMIYKIELAELIKGDGVRDQLTADEIETAKKFRGNR